MGLLANRAEDPDPLDRPTRTDQGHLLFAGGLTRLAQGEADGQPVALAVEGLDMLLAEVEVVGGDRDRDRVTPRGEGPRQAAATEGLERLARRHPLGVGGNQEHLSAGPGATQLGDTVCRGLRALVRPLIQIDTQAHQARADRPTQRGDAGVDAGEHQGVQTAHGGEVGADVLLHLVRPDLKRQGRPGMPALSG